MKIAMLSLFLISNAVQCVWAQVPTLGTYPATNIGTAGGNTTVMPSAAPTNAASTTANTSANFKGLLQANLVTGVVTITNAHPAGTYTITVKAFNGFLTVTSSFVLTVNNTLCSQAFFSPATSVTVGDNPYSAAVADFNNDGKQDFIAKGTGNIASIRLGNGMGGFSGTGTVTIGQAARSFAISDFNGDGKQDFAAAISSGNTVAIRLGDGTGGFGGTTQVNVEQAPWSIATGDFNGDGKQDFAVTNANSSSVSVRLGDGAGNFAGNTQVPVGGTPESIATGDFNSDGNEDFATANRSGFNGNTFSIRLGDGAGGFTGTTNISTFQDPRSVAVADLNGDGKPDIALLYSGGVATYLGNGDGSFKTPIHTNVGAESIAIGDFNGDGKQDIAAANKTNAYISIRLGDGTGSFYGTTNTAVAYSPNYVAVGDFNSDGKQDLISAHLFYDAISIVLQKSEIADINVQGNNTDIGDGDNIPDPADNTDFGNVSSSLIRSFTIQNKGLGNLTVRNILVSGADSALFVISSITSYSIIAPGNSAIFKVTFVPTSAGLKFATVTINSDDCDTAVYNFALQGTGIAVVPSLGNYPATIIGTAGGNAIITPSAMPTNAAAITAFTSPFFNGQMVANPITGVIVITNAHPAGTYSVTVKVNGVATATSSFVLTVNNPVCSQGTFTKIVTNTGVYEPIKLAINDFNNDGKQDIVSTDYGSLKIRLGDGAGNFTVANTVSGIYVVSGDFNSDGKQDILVEINSVINVCFGDGAGGFSTPTSLSIVGRLITVSDVNGDGKPDLLVPGYSNYVSIYLGNGAGTFGPETKISMPYATSYIAVGDFNGDGKPDFAATQYNTSVISIHLGDGAGGFSGTPVVPAINGSESLAIGDFNNDGKQDIAVSSTANSVVYILSGNGAGGFIGTTVVMVDYGSRHIAIADFNGDGNQDFAVISNSMSVDVRYGNGTGNFTGTTNSYIGGGGVRTLAIGDLNSDGKHDFVVNGGYNSFTTFFGNANEINLQGNNTSIADGDTTPALADHTDFGSVVNVSNLVRTFSIQNMGTNDLTINSITITGTHASLFTRGGFTLPATISPGFSLNFTVNFSPTGTGIKTATINIGNNDCDESIYDFSIKGEADTCAATGNTNVWLGNTSDWNVADNWSLGLVPQACSRVIVNSGVPFMPQITNSNSICYSLTLNNGATATVKSSGRLKILKKD